MPISNGLSPRCISAPRISCSISWSPVMVLMFFVSLDKWCFKFQGSHESRPQRMPGANPQAHRGRRDGLVPVAAYVDFVEELIHGRSEPVQGARRVDCRSAHRRYIARGRVKVRQRHYCLAPYAVVRGVVQIRVPAAHPLACGPLIGLLLAHRLAVSLQLPALETVRHPCFAAHRLEI